MKSACWQHVRCGALACLALACQPSLNAASVTLGWRPPQTTDGVKGYWLYCGRQPSPSTISTNFNYGSATGLQYYPNDPNWASVSTNRSANADMFTFVPAAKTSTEVLFNPNEGGVWFFTVQSLSSSGLLSTNSNQTAFMVPPGEPQGPEPLLTTANLNLKESGSFDIRLENINNPTAWYIRTHLSYFRNNLTALTWPVGPMRDPEQLKEDLNTNVIQGPLIFSSVPYMDGVNLRPALWDSMVFVAEESPQDDNNVRCLNRLLLEDFFPMELGNPYAPAAPDSQVIRVTPNPAGNAMTSGSATVLQDASSWTWNTDRHMPKSKFSYQSRDSADTNQALYAVLVARWTNGIPTLPAGSNLVLNIDGTFSYTLDDSVRDASAPAFDYVIKGVTGFSHTNAVNIQIDPLGAESKFNTDPSPSGEATPAVRQRPTIPAGPDTASALGALENPSRSSLGATKLTPRIQPDGRLNLQVDAVAGITYRLQVSANLIDWTELLSTNVPTASFNWVDPDPPTQQRFYRLQQF